MQTYNQLEYNHLTNKFYDPNDWVSSDLGYPSPGDYCIVAYMAGDNNATHYSIAQYTKDGFEEFNTETVIPDYNLLAWKYLGDLPY